MKILITLILTTAILSLTSCAAKKCNAPCNKSTVVCKK